MLNISALIAESQALVGRALASLLREARPDWSIGDAGGLDELRDRVAAISPDLVLLDLRLAGVEGLRALRATFPHTIFAVLSDVDDRTAILACLEAGAQGYILKSIDPKQFIRALETILSGGFYAPATLSISPIHAPEPCRPAEPIRGPVPPDLTERQRQVFALISEGCNTKTIARRLDLAVGTVKTHLAAIYRTLGASSRLEALAKAHRALNA